MVDKFNRNIIALALALILLPAALACGSATPGSTPESAGAVTKKAVVVHLTGQVILPRYQTAAAEISSLNQDAQALCQAPSLPALKDARQSWRAARTAWKATEPMRFGPVMLRKSQGLVDWPTEPEKIDKMLAGRDSITVYDVREFLPSNLRGLAAMEYMLFGEDDDSVLAALSDPATLRCAYLTALSEAATAEVDVVLTHWTQGDGDKPPYQTVFDGTASSSLHESAALADLVSSIIFLNRKIASMRLAPALGLNGHAPDPSAIEGGPAHHTVAELRSQIISVQDVYRGAGQDGPGLSHLVRQLSPEADQQTVAALDSTLAAIDALTEPLPETALSNPQPVQELFDRVSELERLFNADVASLLNVSVGFSDQDGDS